MTDEFDPLKDALRDSLHRHAADAPRGDMLAERIINTAPLADLDRHRARRGWPTWTLPLVAAGAVGAVVAGVLGVQSLHTTASKVPPSSELPTLLQSPTVTQQQSTPPSNPPTTTTGNSGGLTNVKITDLTFYGDNHGWALGSADCINRPGRCTAMWQTTDGRNWTSMGGEQFNVEGVNGCADPCVDHIRFATLQVGYAFGPSAFFMTTDGGASWQHRPGGAIQLETLDGNVIRVTGTDSACPGPCITGIETSDVGSTDWTPADFQPDHSTVGDVLLARGNGGYAYLLVTGQPTGGAENATSTLYRSTDLGLTWHNAGEPCPQGADEFDSVAVAGGDQGRVAVLCQRRQGPPTYWVATSTDAGASWVRQPGTVPEMSPLVLTGDPATVLVAAGIDGMARSTDGGATWQTVGDVLGGFGWVGFESQQVGRAVSIDQRTIWTTRDGGATWHQAFIG